MDCDRNRRNEKRKLPRDRRLKRGKNAVINHSIKARAIRTRKK